MNNTYFDTARTEIMPWLPGRVSRLLDVGCGTGATTDAVRKARDVIWAGGIEYLPSVAEQAAPLFDRLWVGDAAQQPLEETISPGSLDLVLCLDVLEHMVDPWSMVQRLGGMLAPGGRLIVSVPNIRNYRFIWRLLTRGDFRYRDFGLLDRTHLRFFVRETAIELAVSGGLSLVHAGSVQRLKPYELRGILNALSFGRLDTFFAKQWLIVAEKPA
ncbi:MAG: class I SAM-dependent methyltransferase [Beijerinckiaceae bacterium]|jgi:2-polyprenyl-3-methyl-5-hydroxy-6-metoxy-1,4-benzoquinol methylase|nr:class I SAM-dependent methyltransferase [Beijerinckiaceae bacterium]